MSDEDEVTSFVGRRVAYATQNALSPIAQAADVIAAYSGDRGFVDTAEVETTLKDRAEALVRHNDTAALEEMLVGQAYGLNSAYQALMQKAMKPDIAAHPDRLNACLNMAMKTQRQCLHTIELLGRLKNPPVSTLIQQNIAQNQQVNNGSALPAQAAGKKLSNELLSESQDHAPLDT